MSKPEEIDALFEQTVRELGGVDIASAAVFLASNDAASYITGHTLNVDGGFLAAGLMFPFDPSKNKPIGATGQ